MSTFFEQVEAASGVPRERIVFVVDANRRRLYAGRPRGVAPEVERVRRFFVVEGRRLGFEVIDLNDAFQADYGARGEKFEYAFDRHWNRLGHYVVAREILGTRLWRRLWGAPRRIKSLRPSGEVY